MESDPRKLIVLGFDSGLKAQEALLAALRLQEEGRIKLHDAVFVAKDEAGVTTVQETVDLPTDEAALRGGLWGMVFGSLLGGPVGGLVGGALTAGVSALVAKIVDLGIPDAKVAALRDLVTPGTTALAILLSDVHHLALVKEMERFAGARIVDTDLPERLVGELREALSKAE